jgi:hypothetical protein
MKISDWFFTLFPFLFPRKKRQIKSELEGIFQQRWIIVKNRLRFEEILQPKFRVSEASGAYHSKGIIVISYSEMFKSKEEPLTTIDHEIAHSIQYFRNPTIRKGYRIDILGATCWFLTGKLMTGTLNSNLAKRAFREGFATYVAYLTSGKVNTKVERTMKIIHSGKRWKMLLKTNVLPYVLGYLAYSAIAQVKSEERAIQLGLSADFSEWVSEGRVAYTKLGERTN